MMTRVPSSLDNNWQFCLLTPKGRGAIATIALTGKGALGALCRRFKPATGRELTAHSAGRAAYGRFHSTATSNEDIVIGICADNDVEIHCHGGDAAAGAICEALVADGGKVVSAADWVKRAENDEIAADALLALGDVRTERAAGILLDQYRGALRQRFTEIGRFLEVGELTTAGIEIDKLLQKADFGLHLTQPWKVVLAGRPNVGKSSLMNALLGYERSIVWWEPGTTRDALTATTAIDGWWVELCDVAGLRQTSERLEATGVARAERQLAHAELVIFVCDVTEAWDEEFYQDCTQQLNVAGVHRRVMIVHNKCDLLVQPNRGRPAGVATSALKGEGLVQLCKEIVKTLIPSIPDAGEAVPFTSLQVDSLQTASTDLRRGNVAAAQLSIKKMISH